MSELLKKKIIFVITKSNFGGAQRYVYDLATSLPKDSFDVLVAFGEGGELEEKLKSAGIRTLKIDTLQRDVSLFKDFSVCGELIKIFKKEKPDVVHLNSTKIGGVGTVAGRICGVPKIIFTAHGWAFNEKRSLPSKITIALLQWVMVMLSHTTIAVSQKTADQILAFPFITSQKIKVIYNGTSEIDFVDRPQAQQIILGNKASNKAILIGTISELHTNKGLDVALDAFASVVKKHPNNHFVIIGAGEEKERLVAQINNLELTEKVSLTGFIADAKKYLKALDIFTLTSRTEALPYAILEAGLAGLPVIASSVGGIPEIINSSEVGILVPTGPQAPLSIAEAIEKLITNPELAKKIGSNLHQHVTSEFSREKMHTQTFALYQ